MFDWVLNTPVVRAMKIAIIMIIMIMNTQNRRDLKRKYIFKVYTKDIRKTFIGVVLVSLLLTWNGYLPTGDCNQLARMY